ncbi:MAG TPA: hypothetical protein VNK48_00190 [Xanthobacteraceae bacterium]|nr:hypothetical protein [Xanthobacteraceae bacterium]
MALLLAPAPGAAGAQPVQDISLVPFERSGQPLKLTHRTTAPELSALEEFGIDDDAERHVKAFPRACRAALPISWPEPAVKSSYCAPLSPYRCCAAPPTGPPHV